MPVGKRSNVAKAKKGRGTTPSSTLPIRVSNYHTVNLSADTYLKLRSLANHYEQTLGHMVSILVDAGCVGANVK